MHARKRRGVLLLLAMSAFVASCDDEAAEPPRSDVPEDAVVFEVEGGIAGFAERLVVDPTGRAEVFALGTGDRKGEFRLSTSEQRELERLLRSANLDTLDDTYEAPGSVGDDMVVRIQHEGHSVEADASAAPEPLTPLISNLVRLVGRSR